MASSEPKNAPSASAPNALGGSPFVPNDFSDREILITRVFEAPRELVYQAWTDPDVITLWWGPVGFSTTTDSMDMRPGGVWKFTMHGPDGRDYRNRITYDEVVPAERLVYRHGGDEQTVQVTFKTTVTIAVADGDPAKTKLTMRMVFPSAAERDRISRMYGAVEGGMDTISRLSAQVAKGTGVQSKRLVIALPTPTEILMRRVFQAPRELLWEAMSKPEHVRQWWGPRRLTITACEMDFRVGGQWRIVHQRPGDTTEQPFRGEYLEIASPEKIVQTFVYDVEGIRDYPATETMTLTERDGVTTLTTHVKHLSQQARDGHLNSGMEPGASETMDRLEEFVGTLQET